MRSTNWTNEQIEYLKTNYLEQSFEELAKNLNISSSVIKRKSKELGLPEKNQTKRIEKQYGTDICSLLKLLHWERGMSVKQMSVELGISRLWINTKMKECGIEWRDRSSAEKLKWSKMTRDQRQKQTRSAHRASLKLFEDGKNVFKLWRENNPELARKIYQNNGRNMSRIRDAAGHNGMIGKLGPLHHRWKGGKDEYHRLRSLIPGNWWINRKKALERDNRTCQRCGAKGDGVIIDVHHKVEVRSGGTNLLDNLICYCRSCHMIVEKGK